jgi:hypothetical protein
VGGLVRVQEAVDAIDLTKIAEYTRKLKDIGSGFNKMMAPVYLRDFVIAFDVSSVMLARAIQADLQTKSELETAEAIAFLDRAPDYFKAKGEKPTVESRKAYVALDPDVIQAKELQAKTTALVSLLRNKVIEFREAISAIKTLQSDGYLSPHEGSR